jgi:hypothetical protein
MTTALVLQGTIIKKCASGEAPAQALAGAAGSHSATPAPPPAQKPLLLYASPRPDD